MAAAKKDAGDGAQKDSGGGDAIDNPALEQATELGYLGVKVDPNPNEAHSLESGPDSPSAVPDNKTRSPQVVAE